MSSDSIPRKIFSPKLKTRKTSFLLIQKLKSLLLFCVCLFFFLFQLRAEGTKQVAPSSSDVTALYTNNTIYGSFASYGGPEETRLNIHIADPATELVYLGFSRRMSTSTATDGNLLTNSPYYFRVVDPNGNVVYGPILINDSSVNMDTWALANAGPAPIAGGSGYTPFTYTPAAGAIAGDYYVEFSTNQNSSSNGNTLPIKYWDITVSDQSTPAEIPGRIWSKKWSFRTPSMSGGTDPTYGSFDRPFNGQIYTYSDDGFVFEIDFDGSGFRGLSFNLAFNDFGTSGEADLLESRKSDNGFNTTLGQYKLFLNNPDNAIYPSGSIGSIGAPPFIKYCPGDTLCISYSVTDIGQVEILLDFDTGSGAGVYDEGTADVLLLENVTLAPGETSPLERCVNWDGEDGLGNTVSLSSQIPIYFSYFQGIVHFPVYDVEYMPIGLQINPVRPSPVPGYVVEPRFDDEKIPEDRFTGAAESDFDGCTMACHNWTVRNFGDLNTVNTWWFMNQLDISTLIIPECPINAVNDYNTTDIEVAVTTDVISNDEGTLLDVSTLSISGLTGPTNGTITNVNTSTGEITYLPANNFTGIDSFQYLICESGAMPECDTAWVFITVNCGSITGQNWIYGSVFLDSNTDTLLSSGEQGASGIEVNVYEDLNENGKVDSGENIATTGTTDGTGAFAIQVSPSFEQTVVDEDISSIAINSSTGCNGTQITRTIFVAENLIISDLNFGVNLSHVYRSDVEVALIAPDGTTVVVIEGNSSGGDNDDNYDVLLDDSSGNNLDDGNADNVSTPYYDRTASPDNPLSAFNGRNAFGNWTVTICDRFPSADDGIYFRSQLNITGSGEGAGQYVVTVDTTTIPADSYMTTDSLETVSFSEIGESDCSNDFGYASACNISISDSTLICPSGGGDASTMYDFGLTGTWSVISEPSGASSSVSATGLVTNMAEVGDYIFEIIDDSCSEQATITRPECCPVAECVPLEVVLFKGE